MHDADSMAMPKLPPVLALPLKQIPDPIHSALLARALNVVLGTPIRDGELDPLAGMVVWVEVRDAGIRFTLTLTHRALRPAPPRESPDLRIAGDVYDFLLLLSRREDADTLFFRRRLIMEGDTELGLLVKNMLDALDVDGMRWFRPLDRLLQHAVPVYRRWFG